MNDRELVEAAAKAAGVSTAQINIGAWCGCAWNPLFDDREAFRLMVKLGIEVVSHSDTVEADGIHEDRSSDDCQAMRRAIVRAAAAIGSSGEREGETRG